jgi:hypothetical protein
MMPLGDLPLDREAGFVADVDRDLDPEAGPLSRSG